MKISQYLALSLVILSVAICSHGEATSKVAEPEKVTKPQFLGFGQNTTGGQGGQTILVTTLADNDAKGSLRFAIKQKYPRIIKFTVSGVIKLNTPLKINRGSVTIEGQSSPNGIALVGAPFTVSADNVIIQHMRFRLGTFGFAEDALTVRNTQNVVIDHCSISWGIDETASLYNNHNFTLQNSIIANSLNNSIHPKGEHGYGGIWGGHNASFINNLVANHKSRTPRLNGHRLKAPYPITDEYVELINNVIYNWGQNSVYGSENGRFSLVNNYYLPGPDTKKVHFLDLWFSDRLNSPQAFISGNEMAGKAWLNDNLLGVIVRDKNKEKVAAHKQLTQFSVQPISNHALSYYPQRVSSQQALDNVIIKRDVGAYLTAIGKFHDSVDRQVLQQLNEIISGKTVTSGIIDHEHQQIPSLAIYQAEFENGAKQ